MLSKITRLVTTLVILLGLFACGDKPHASLEKYVREVKSRNSHQIEPVPQPKPHEHYAYPKTHTRNPFMKVVEQDGLGRPDLSRPKEPLEAFALDSLRMVGTVHHNDRLWAVMAAPDGAVYRVSVGNYMGQNFGKIKKIDEQEVIVEETVTAATGWESRSSKLALSEGGS